MLYSPFVTWDQEIYGKLVPPNDVTDFQMVAQGDQAQLSWTKVTDLDVSIGGSYWLRYTSKTSGVTWSDATDITKNIPGNSDSYSAPLMAGTYLIKALDSSGNESTNAVLIESNVADLMGLNAVYTTTQHPSFGSGTADKGINDSNTSNIFYDTVNNVIQLSAAQLATGTHDAYYAVGTHEDDIVSSGTHDDARLSGTANDILVTGTHDDNLAAGTHDDARATGTHNAILNAGSTELNGENFFDTASGSWDSRSGNFDDISHTTNMLEDDNASFDSSWLNNIVRNTTDNTTATVTAVTSSTRLTLSSDLFDGISGEAYRLETKINQLRDTSATFTAADVGRTIRNITDGGTATISSIDSGNLVTLSSSLFLNDHGDTWELEAGPNVLRDTGAAFTAALVGRTVRNTTDGTTATVSSYTNANELVLSSGIFDNKDTHNYEVEAVPNKLYNTAGGFTASHVGNLVRNTNDNTTATVSAYVSANELTLSSGIFDNKNGHTYNVHNEASRLRDLTATFSAADVGRTVRNNTDNTTATISSLISGTEVALSSGIFDDQNGDIWELEAGPNYLRDTGATFPSSLVGRTVRNTTDGTTATVSSFVNANELVLSSGIFDNKDGHVYEVEPGYDRLYDPSASFTSEVVGKVVRNTTDNTTATVSSRVSGTELVLSSGIFDNQDGEGYRIEVPSFILRDTGASFTSAHDNKVIWNTDTGLSTHVFSVTDSNNLVVSDNIFGQTNGSNYQVDGDIASVGYYYFTDQSIDLGQVYTSRLTANYSSSSFTTSDLFDFEGGNFDSGSGLFDGTDISDTNSLIQVRTTSDDPSSSPTWGSWYNFFIGDYTARGFQFRAKLTSANTTHNVKISDLSATIDMPDTIKRETQVQSDSGTNNGTKVITYTVPFKTTPTVGITMSTSDTGDYYTISNSNTSGFTVTFYNSSNTATQKTFNWMSSGY